jgi:post-segregation antitoxin (ccd killing protein)
MKRRVEIEVDADLLAEAEALGLDLSLAFEVGLRRKVWQQRDARALDAAHEERSQAPDEVPAHDPSDDLLAAKTVPDRPDLPKSSVQARGPAPSDLDLEADVPADIIAFIEAWAGSRAQAVAWFTSQPLPSFGNLTAADLVQRGGADAVRAYFKRTAVGGYT